MGALAAGLPDTTELVEVNQEHAQRLITAQRELAIRLIEISSRKDG